VVDKAVREEKTGARLEVGKSIRRKEKSCLALGRQDSGKSCCNAVLVIKEAVAQQHSIWPASPLESPDKLQTLYITPGLGTL
jgi:hypothetical protein